MKVKPVLRGTFRRHGLLFRRYAFDVMSRSSEYQDVETQLDAILLLANRVFIAFEEELNFNQVQRISQSLQKVNEAIDFSFAKIDEARKKACRRWTLLSRPKRGG